MSLIEQICNDCGETFHDSKVYPTCKTCAEALTVEAQFPTYVLDRHEVGVVVAYEDAMRDCYV